MGNQNLYNITTTFVASNGATVSTTRRIGFRVFALVTADDSNPSILQGENGSSNFTMRFKVNGADVCTNSVPLSVCLSLCLSLSFSVSLCLSVSLSLCLSASLSLCLSVSMSLYLLSVSVSLSFSVSLCLFLSLCLSRDKEIRREGRG
jgi:hypothetical protein